MKASIVSTVCSVLLTAVSAVPLEKRQGLLDSIPAKEIKPYKVENLAPTMNMKGAKRARITYGPFTILGTEEAKADKPVFRLDPGSTAWFSKIDGGFPSGATILKTNSSITMMDGSPAEIAQGIYNHHTVFFDTSKQSSIITDCPNMSAEDKATIRSRPLMSIVAGTGEDNSKIVYAASNATFNSGFWLAKEDQLMMMGEIINYKKEAQKVFSVTEVEYVDGKLDGLLDAFSAVLSVNMCAPLSKDGRPQPVEVPQGQTKAMISSDPIIVTQGGYIVNANGHLHDGGDFIAMKINGREVCISKARYGGAGKEMTNEDGEVWSTLSHMDVCSKPIKVNKGDKIELEAKYDYEAHPPRKFAGGMAGTGEIMGLFGVSFAPDPK